MLANQKPSLKALRPLPCTATPPRADLLLLQQIVRFCKRINELQQARGVGQGGAWGGGVSPVRIVASATDQLA